MKTRKSSSNLKRLSRVGIVAGVHTRRKRSGFLWLAEAVGPALIIDVYGALTAPITGINKRGDVDIGSGLVLDSTHILTNKHIVEDMTVDDEIPSPLATPSVLWNQWHQQPETVRVVHTVPHETSDLSRPDVGRPRPRVWLSTRPHHGCRSSGASGWRGREPGSEKPGRRTVFPLLLHDTTGQQWRPHRRPGWARHWHRRA